MRKLLIAAVVVSLIGGTAAYAGTTSLVGRKIQSEVSVNLDGKEIGSGFVVDGTTYAPLRLIAESTGLSVGYKKGETKGEVSLTNVETENEIDVAGLTKERRSLSIRAEFLTSAIADCERMIERHTESIKIADDQSVDFFVEGLAQVTEERAGYVSELAQVNARIAEIDEILDQQ